MAVEIGVAAAYLVVGDDQAARVGDAVEHLEIVVRTARPAVEQQQGCFLCCLAHYAVVGLVAHKRHIALSDCVVHNLLDNGIRFYYANILHSNLIKRKGEPVWMMLPMPRLYWEQTKGTLSIKQSPMNKSVSYSLLFISIVVLPLPLSSRDS